MPAKEEPKTKMELLRKQSIINLKNFCQLTEFDEDDSDFTRGIADEFYDQAEATLTEIRDAFKKDDLVLVSHRAHFLKGSSGQLGLIKLQNACNNMQYYGKLRDEELDKDLSKEEAVDLIKKEMEIADEGFKEGRELLDRYFEAPGESPKLDDLEDSEEDEPEPPKKKK